MSNRKWLIEETEDVRRIQSGEYFLSREGNIQRWLCEGQSASGYLILKVTEITNDDDTPKGWDEW